MEKILKKEFGLDGKYRLSMYAMILMFLIISIFFYVKLKSKIESVVLEEAQRNITNISELNADAVYREISNRQILLKAVSDNVAASHIEDVDEIIDKMLLYVNNYNFYNMGVMTPDGMLHTTSGKVVDITLQDSPYKDALNGQPMISESFMPLDGGDKNVNLMSTPVYIGRKLKYIITATYYSYDLAENMNTSALHDQGYNYLLNSQGDMAIYPKAGEDKEYLDLMRHINKNMNISPSQGKTIDFEYNGDLYYAHFEDLHINDWCLMTCYKQETVFQGFHAILSSVFQCMGFLWIQIVWSVAFIILLSIRFQEKTHKIVFYDDLLKEKNAEYMRIYFQHIPEDKMEQKAFIALDVDKFKEFNFIHGNESGDRLLKYISRTFHKVLPKDEIFRYSADLFVAMVDGKNKEEVENKIKSLLARIVEDIEKNKIQPFDISIGIRMLKKGDGIRTVHSDALIAKKTVKGNHVQKYAFYDEQMRRERIEFMEMESDFHRALKYDEFQVYYQPKYDMRTEKVVGAEALVRWVKEDGTMISPGAFIPCFEKNRQIVMLDEMMIEKVCHQMKEMKEEGIEVLPVSVNLSRVHLKYPGILKKIEAVLEETGVNPSNLSFEITESALYEDSEPLKKVIDRLHKLGCKVNMDDYGMGVSGPNSLISNEFDVIKMDKSFIDGIGEKKAESVIRSTICLSKELGMTILAEGVEEKSQADTLMKWGCHLAQGFYYSKPVPESRYRNLLIENEG
ncbi:MAG: EAL domain-containing protein [Eubacteriales bacterium]|nr:EAL domain-containing protein [Eubacteriales bacterium]